jgi:hypothetical protein
MHQLALRMMPELNLEGPGFIYLKLSRLAPLHNKNHFVVLQCQRLRETAALLSTKRILQIVSRAQRSIQVVLIH